MVTDKVSSIFFWDILLSFQNNTNHEISLVSRNLWQDFSLLMLAKLGTVNDNNEIYLVKIPLAEK